MKPDSIVRFDRFFLGSLALGLINSVVSFQRSQAMLEADPATAELGFGSGFLISIILFSLGIPLLLWFLISRRASNVAKWILVILTALGLLFMIPMAGEILSGGLLENGLTLGVTGLQLIAIYFLFQRDARDWLESKGQGGPPDASVFD